jgi:hypothetical protein
MDFQRFTKFMFQDDIQNVLLDKNLTPFLIKSDGETFSIPINTTYYVTQLYYLCTVINNDNAVENIDKAFELTKINYFAGYDKNNNIYEYFFINR